MALESKIRGDLREAVKQRDEARVLVLRLVLSEMKNAEIARRESLDESAALGVLGGEVKRHRESIDLFRKGNRSDLVAQEEGELSVLMEYMPPQMSRQEIVIAAREAIDAVSAKGIKDKGRVMSQLMPGLRGRAEGKDVSDAVSELLAGSQVVQ